MGAAPALAKKKSGKKPGPKPSPTGPRTSLIAIKCWQDYKEWFDELAQADDRPASTVFERAMADYAKKIGFREPPER